MVVGVFKKILLLQWKNLLVIRRSPIATFFELLLPLGMINLCIQQLQGNDLEGNPLPTFYTAYSEKDILLSLPPEARIVYVPDTEFTKQLMTEATDKLPTFVSSRLRGLANEKQVQEMVDNVSSEHRPGAKREPVIAVVFAQADPRTRRLDFKVRTQDRAWKTGHRLRLQVKDRPSSGALLEPYLTSGFLAVQLAVESAFVKLANTPARVESQAPAPVAVERFPFPPYAASKAKDFEFGYLFTLGLVVLVANVVNGIMSDKVSGATELMKLMGLSRGMLWFSWFLRGFLMCELITTFYVWYVFSYFNLMPQSDPWLLWLTVTLFSVATGAFICALSTFFYSGVFAIIACVIIWLTYSILFQNIPEKPWMKALVFQLLTIMVPSRAIEVACQRVTLLEGNGVGLQWHNVEFSPLDDPLTFAHVLWVLTAQTLLFALVTWYVDAVRPGPFGLPEPWHFCLTRCCRRKSQYGDETESSSSASSEANYERVPETLDVAIRVEALRKTYPSGKVAVDGVTFDVYDDQITALLGHNGAGKTTTMSMITGMMPSTSGDIWVHGYNTRTDLRRVRDSMGLCPQHNMLFSKLTILNHLVFFAMLKGCGYREAKEDARAMVEMLDLTKAEKAGKTAGQLSGGMQRKLSLAIALVGGSRVVILDEPTSGLDPEARRKVWDLLLDMRGQRTILLTTHFMEEADALGDRIAIMHNGRVQCYGTALYLKKLYGSGYELKLLTTPHADADAVARFVRSHLSSARLKARLGAELSFDLPQRDKGSFAALFEAIEANKARLGVVSIGVSMATLEDVFIAVDKAASGERDSGEDDEDAQRRQRDAPALRRTRGLLLKIQQAYAVGVKRALQMRRNLELQIIPVVLALLCLLLVLATGRTVLTDVAEPQPALTLSLAAYAPTTVAFSAPGDVGVHLAALATASGADARPVGDVRAAIVDVGVADLDEYARWVVAADMSTPTQAFALFSAESVHGAPLAVTLVHNAQLRAATGAADALITVTNHPFETSATETEMEMELSANLVALLWLLFVPFGVGIPLATLLGLLVAERVSGAKHLQLMTGITPLVYWMANALLDLLVYVILVLMLLVTFVAWDWQDRYYGGSEEHGVFSLILLVFGLAALPYTYLFHYLTDSSAAAFSFYIIVNAIIPIVPILSSIIGPKFYKLCNFVMLWVPPYGLGVAMQQFVKLALTNNRCAAMDDHVKATHCAQNPTDVCCAGDGGPAPPHVAYLGAATEAQPYTLRATLMRLCLDALVYLLLLAVLDSGLVADGLECLKAALARPSDRLTTLEDDVLVEAERVADNADSDDTLAVERLTKLHGLCFWRQLAVRGISFGVPPGECFGLLGVNGAGKTTTFRMLVGQLTRTRGFVRVQDPQRASTRRHHLNTHLIGYCPQFDAFCEALTGREVLYMFARLRGVHRSQLRAHVDRWLLIMGLTDFEDKLSGTYSGGNKRKLSTALALVGNPPLVLLDEPTCGVDPIARRNLWKVLAAVQTADTAIVLTSHSMDECEALCSRLAIMVRGQFRCLGSSQHLKHKYGQGFTVLVTLRRAVSDPDAVLAFQTAMRRDFPSAVIKGDHQVLPRDMCAKGVLNYHVTDPKVRWGTLFSGLDALKGKHANVEDYQVSETSLEQVFLSFARRDEDSSPTE